MHGLGYVLPTPALAYQHLYEGERPAWALGNRRGDEPGNFQGTLVLSR